MIKDKLNIYKKMYEQIYAIYDEHINSTWFNEDWCEMYLEQLYKMKEALEKLIELEQE